MAYDGRSPGGYQPKPWDREQEHVPRALPAGYLQGGYFEPGHDGGKPVLRKEYIVGYPEQIARALEDRDKNKSSQLRRFYDYCIRIRSMQERGRAFEQVQAEFCRLVPFADYAQTRNTVTPLFVDFIRKNVQAVRNADDLYAFVKHFEAVVAHIKK